MNEIGWILFFVFGVAILLARMFIPPAKNQSVIMRRLAVALAVAFVLSIWVFILVYDNYQNLNFQLKRQEFEWSRKIAIAQMAREK